MITLIGTGHVFNLSQALLNIFDEKQPEIFCVELDRQRFNALLMKQNNPEKYKEAQKNLPAIYKMMAKFQEGMANEYGVTAGDEMLTTINYAKNHQLPVAFIDMNAQKLFSKMLKSMTFSEKFRLMISGFAGLFVSKKRVEKEMSKIDKDLDSYIDQVSKKFPTIKRILIDERNEYMVAQIAKAKEDYEKIVVIIGDGHVPGISKMLEEKKLEYETVRLSEIRNQTPAKGDSSTASFSMEYKGL